MRYVSVIIMSIIGDCHSFLRDKSTK